jgi:hypothetical protein
MGNTSAKNDCVGLGVALICIGQMPVSVAVNGIHVYVVNAGGTPNISGFIIDPIGGHLVPLPNSQRPLAGGTLAMPGDISFNADGSVLLVSEKGPRWEPLLHRFGLSDGGHRKAAANTVGKLDLEVS